MSTTVTEIPKSLLPTLKVVVPIAMGITASTNFDSLMKLGNTIYGNGLAWTLPAMIIGYEFISSAILFLTPRELPSIRKAALVGAILGFAVTLALAILWTVIEGGDGMWLKIGMKPIPSIIAAAFAHMLVLAWHADLAAKAAMSGTETPTVPPKPGNRPAPVPVIPAPATAPVPPPAVRQPVLPPQTPRQEVLVATPHQAPPVAKPRPLPEQPVADPRLPSVARVHVEQAKKVLREIASQGGNPGALESGQAMKHFPGIKDRQVRNALIVACHELGIERKPRRLAVAVPVSA